MIGTEPFCYNHFNNIWVTTLLVHNSFQAQIAEFRSFEAQEMSTEERVQTLRVREIMADPILIEYQMSFLPRMCCTPGTS
jgi:hypothetical protein